MVGQERKVPFTWVLRESVLGIVGVIYSLLVLSERSLEGYPTSILVTVSIVGALVGVASIAISYRTAINDDTSGRRALRDPLTVTLIIVAASVFIGLVFLFESSLTPLIALILGFSFALPLGFLFVKLRW
ncbi:hypothetical protein [Halomarina pelagica]|uniref:hypothetical protein n=1 Tax=Halomarina pelagica TaxID=2961599 RepID=UPI0020C22AC6|nr:hypothetical protein [Halomarina sp. BND7]